MHHKKVTVEQCHVLDIRQLQASLGHAWAAVVDTTDRADPTVSLSYTTMPNETRVLCTVQLVTTPGYRGGVCGFYCPLIKNGEPCHRRCRKLYLPPGQRYFACRQCYNLTYRTCQVSHMYDTLAKNLGMTTAQVRQALVGSR